MVLPLMLILSLYLHLEQVQHAALVRVYANETIVHPGKTTRTFVRVKVLDGYHIQANRVTDESLIPTTLEIKHEEIVVTKEKFPRGKKLRLEGSDNFLNVYDGDFQIQLFLRAAANVEGGKYFLNAQLKFQPCNASTCLFPRTVNFLIPVEIKEKSKPRHPRI